MSGACAATVPPVPLPFPFVRSLQDPPSQEGIHGASASGTPLHPGQLFAVAKVPTSRLISSSSSSFSCLCPSSSRLLLLFLLLPPSSVVDDESCSELLRSQPILVLSSVSSNKDVSLYACLRAA